MRLGKARGQSNNQARLRLAMKKPIKIWSNDSPAPEFLICDPQTFYADAAHALAMFAQSDKLVAIVLPMDWPGEMVCQFDELPQSEVVFTSEDGITYGDYLGPGCWHLFGVEYQRPSEMSMSIRVRWHDLDSADECWADLSIPVDAIP